MTTLRLPQLSGGRRRAAALVRSAELPPDMAEASVTVDGRQLVAGSEAFADELVKQVLQDRGAGAMSVVNVGGDFAEYLERSAKTRAVAQRLTVDRF